MEGEEEGEERREAEGVVEGLMNENPVHFGEHDANVFVHLLTGVETSAHIW